jgi:hypothetical protein
MSGYRLSGQVLRAPVGRGEVVLNMESGRYHLINGTGRALLASLEEGLSVRDAARRVAESSGESLDRVLADTEAFVVDMVRRGLLEEREV